MISSTSGFVMAQKMPGCGTCRRSSPEERTGAATCMLEASWIGSHLQSSRESQARAGGDAMERGAVWTRLSDGAVTHAAPGSEQRQEDTSRV